MDYARESFASVLQQPQPSSSTASSFSFENTPKLNQPTSNVQHSGIPSQNNNRVENNTEERSYTPKRTNAIILENTQQFKQVECLRATADLIGGHNIHYCTRLSGGRICMYLTNQTLVDNLCAEGGLLIGSVYIPVRRYVTDATKFIISNCPPELPDDDLKKILEPYGKIVSAQTRLKVSVSNSDDDLKHIMTWRRSVFIMVPQDAPEMPRKILLNGPNSTKFTLYIERDEVVCKFCCLPGHVEEKCKKKLSHQQQFPTINAPVSNRLFVRNQTSLASTSRDPPVSVNALTPIFVHSLNQNSKPNNPSEILNSDDEPQISNNSNPPFTTETPLQQQEEDQQTENQDPQENHDQLAMDMDQELQSINASSQPASQSDTTKRVHSPTDEDDDRSSQFDRDSSTSSSSLPRPKKKLKKKEKEKEALNAVLNSLKYEENFLSPVDFTLFMKDCRGKQNSRQVASKFTENFGALIVQLNQAERLCMDFNLRRRFQRAAEALIASNSQNEEMED